MDNLDYLIQYLLKENKDIKVNEIPEDINDRKNLFRSLCNIRDAKPISNEFLKVQDEYLQTELLSKGITKVEDIIPLEDNICLWKGDITTLKVQAIVNAGNSVGLRLFYSLS